MTTPTPRTGSVSNPGETVGKLKVLAIYGWREFWSMGEGRGAPSFFLSITSFPKRGHEMHVLLPGPPESPLEEDYHGVSLHRFHTVVDFMPGVENSRFLRHVKRFVSYLYWFARALPAGRALAERIGADVIIGMGELGAPAAYRIARARGVPNVTRLFGIGMYLDEMMGSPLRFALRYRETRAIRTPADYIILCDDGSRGDELARHLGVDMARLLFWPNGVDKARHMSSTPGTDVRAKLGIPGSRRILLSVSRLDFEKHLDRAIEALPAVVSARDDVTLVVVGTGEEKGALEALAKSLRVDDHVVFTGSVGREELPDYYKAADVFIALSDRTNVSNSLHEAMMSGLPVIVLNTGSTSDVVHDGETGFVIEPDDLGRLPGAVLSLLNDDGLRESMGRRSQADADSRLRTLEERQVMEVEVAERAVRERGERARRGDDAR